MTREALQARLETILGSRNVYFMPPKNVAIKYPCFIYTRQRSFTRAANDKAYIRAKNFQITYISKDPDSGIIDTMLDNFEMCVHERSFTSDSLYHDVFDLYC